MTEQLETFRVYNNVGRVGVEWRFGSLKVQPFMFTMFLITSITTALGAGAFLWGMGGLWGIILGALWLLAGLVLVAHVIIIALRLTAMSPEVARINDRTQIRLLRATVSQPWHTNVHTVDTDDAATTYRNY